MITPWQRATENYHHHHWNRNLGINGQADLRSILLQREQRLGLGTSGGSLGYRSCTEEEPL